MAINLWRYYYQCIHCSLSAKVTSLIWPQFLGKEGGLIREGLLYTDMITGKNLKHGKMMAQMQAAIVVQSNKAA